MKMWYKLKSKVIQLVADIRLYKGGVILFGDSHYDIKGKHQRKILNLVKPGDVLLRNFKHYLGSIITKGYYSHAAIYTGNNKVIHMLGEGITEEDILTFMRCDDLAILRYQSVYLSSLAVEIAKEELSRSAEYDFDFDIDCQKRFYCTEFVDYCFGYPVRKGRKKGHILPDDFLKVFEVIYESRKDNFMKSLTDADYKEIEKQIWKRMK